MASQPAQDIREKRAFFPARSRLLVGGILFLVTLGLTWGRWDSIKGPLEDLAWLEQHRSPGDSLAYASAMYHASYARAAQQNRWRLSGYATLGIIGLVVAGGLIASSRFRRTPNEEL
jgi:hypothetical protein